MGWTTRASARVGLQAKTNEWAAANANQTPVAVPAKPSQTMPNQTPAVMPPVMPAPPPVMTPPLTFPNAWQLGNAMHLTQPVPFPMPALPEPPVMHPPTTPVAGQGIFVPPPQLFMPKASSSAGIVELAMGMTSQMSSMNNAIVMLIHHTMAQAQAIQHPPPRQSFRIPNCVDAIALS